MAHLAVTRAFELHPVPEDRRWLIEGLWAEEAVGIVGGEPKCCKSFLALDVAVSVASGTPCLRRYPVRCGGRVLLYAAEDALHVVRQRLEGISAAAKVSFAELDVQVITVPRLRLDVQGDRERLQDTIQRLSPRMVILDPFVRLHEIDENQAAEVAPILAYLRSLQRTHRCAVLLVHHAKKGAAHARAGQALRGSSELHAWGDSNLYLRRRGETLMLTVEHRAAPSIGGLAVELVQDGDALALRISDAPPDCGPRPPPSAVDRVLAALADAPAPMTTRELRASCRIRMATLSEILADLADQGRVERLAIGFRLRR